MRNFYLKKVYSAKENQEKLINNFDRKIEKYILRPKVLSYGDTYIDSLSRKEFAKNILNLVTKNNY